MPLDDLLIVVSCRSQRCCFFANNKELSIWWTAEQLVQVHPGENDSVSAVVVSVPIEQNSLKWKRCTAGYHQRTNDTMYIREFLEIIEPRGIVSILKSSRPRTELWGTPQERVENAEMESLIETVREQDERWDEDQLSERPPKPNHLWRRVRFEGWMIDSIESCK